MAGNLENTATVFFKKFARCEFALKDCGFHKGINRAAEAAELKEAVNYLLNASPQKQYLDNNGNQNSDRTNQLTNHEWIGFFYMFDESETIFFTAQDLTTIGFDPVGSDRLIIHSLTILDACFSPSAVTNCR